MRPFWFMQGMVFLPLSLIIWTYLTFMVSYLLAVSRGDVDPGFPYISDTGARPPESSVFGQMLNISAVLALATLYVRYKQVAGYIEDIPESRYVTVRRLNVIGFGLAILICLGISLVANFQETSVLGVHLAGAFMAFGIGTCYEFLQAYITYKMHPEVNGRKIIAARFTISCFSLVFFIIIFGASATLDMMDRDGNMKLHWKPSDPGYAAHLTSTISEWLLAGSFLSYFYTFIRDFQVITIATDTTLHRTNLYHASADDTQERIRSVVA